jgi:hypothetical protein
LISTAREEHKLRCACDDDLLGPSCERERRRHQQMCAMLNSNYGIQLGVEDFLIQAADEDSSLRTILPIQFIEVQPGSDLLVITCSYTFSDSHRGRPLDRLVLAPDSVEFRLFAAPPSTAA